jgi:hypothetical protein
MQSIEDRDLIAIIGTRQGANKDGVTCKQLYLAGIAPVATVQRRLRRLIRLGILQKRQSGLDARVFHVCLSASAEDSLESYVAFLKGYALSSNNDASVTSSDDQLKLLHLWSGQIPPGPATGRGDLVG